MVGTGHREQGDRAGKVDDQAEGVEQRALAHRHQGVAADHQDEGKAAAEGLAAELFLPHGGEEGDGGQDVHDDADARKEGVGHAHLIEEGGLVDRDRGQEGDEEGEDRPGKGVLGEPGRADGLLEDRRAEEEEGGVEQGEVVEHGDGVRGEDENRRHAVVEG